MDNEYSDKVRKHVEKAMSEGRAERVHYNTVDYVLITEEDGWISIIEASSIKGYVPLMQALNRDKAIDYCVFREPVPVPVNIL